MINVSLLQHSLPQASALEDHLRLLAHHVQDLLVVIITAAAAAKNAVAHKNWNIMFVFYWNEMLTLV